MAKALQKRFTNLIRTHKNKEKNPQREALISALEDAVVVAETLEVDPRNCYYYNYLSDLADCLEKLEEKAALAYCLEKLNKKDNIQDNSELLNRLAAMNELAEILTLSRNKRNINSFLSPKNKGNNLESSVITEAHDYVDRVIKIIEKNPLNCNNDINLTLLTDSLKKLEEEDNIKSNIDSLIKLAQVQSDSIKPETCTANRWKAVGLLIIAALEFVVLALILGALTALAGAAMFGIVCGFISLFFVSDTDALKTVALIGALCGALVGIIAGIYAAFKLTSLSLQLLKTTEWAGFNEHDSLWELAKEGKTKEVLIAERLLKAHSLFQSVDIKVEAESFTSENGISTDI